MKIFSIIILTSLLQINTLNMDEIFLEAKKAEDKLLSYSNIEYKIIRETCVNMLENHLQRTLNDNEKQYKYIYKNKNIPNKLRFISPQYITINTQIKRCSIFLHKGIGRGIGYKVDRYNNKWIISWFNEYIDWNKHEIKIITQ